MTVFQLQLTVNSRKGNPACIQLSWRRSTEIKAPVSELYRGFRQQMKTDNKQSSKERKKRGKTTYICKSIFSMSLNKVWI